MRSKYRIDFFEVLKRFKSNPSITHQKYLILEQWMIFLDFFVYHEGISNLKFIDNKSKTLPKNVLDYYSNKKGIKIRSKNYSLHKILKPLINFLGIFLRINFLSFDRSNIYISKLRDIFSFLYLKYFVLEQKINIDHNAKTLFFNKIKKKIDYKIYLFLKRNISDYFFSIPSCKKKILLYIYPINFLFDKNFLKLLVFYKNPKIYGYQHGAGYGQFINSRLYEFEKNISDKFIDWFPVNKSKYIGRFEKKIIKKRSKGKIFWAGTADPLKIEIFLETDYCKSLKIQRKFIKKIDYFISNLKNAYYVPHPRNIYPKIKTKLFKTVNKLENVLCSNDVVIFDVISSTLMFFCIKNNIEFYIISERKINNIKGITTDYRNFLYKLKKKDRFVYSKNLPILNKKLC